VDDRQTGGMSPRRAPEILEEIEVFFMLKRKHMTYGMLWPVDFEASRHKLKKASCKLRAPQAVRNERRLSA
jgi:hypothetical protein